MTPKTNKSDCGENFATDDKLPCFRIRPMTKNDITAVSYIAAECFSEPWSKKAYDESLTNPLYTASVACCNDKLIGFADVTTVCEIAYINNIAVLPDYRKNSVASKLIYSLISKLGQTNTSEITLEVRSSNKPAIALYKKFGFCVCGKRTNFYRKPTEDALILSLKIKHPDTVTEDINYENSCH